MIDYTPLEPTNFLHAKIESIADDFRKEINFHIGDRIEPLIYRLGGLVKYEAIDNDNKIALTVYSKNNFEISVSAYLGAERFRFWLAHQLGHYVLHSNFGEKSIIAKNWDGENLTPEHEANRFASCFLMPREDLIKQYNDHFENTHYGAKYLWQKLCSRYMIQENLLLQRMSKIGL